MRNTILPGILGFKEGALRLSQLWAKRSKIEYTLSMHERIYRLLEVNPKTPSFAINQFIRYTFYYIFACTIVLLFS